MGCSRCSDVCMMASATRAIARMPRPIACPITMDLAQDDFEFRSIGKHRAKGFDEEHSLYALVRERNTG